MIDVSVLLISYNHAKYIEECLNSILRQKTTFQFEILIHDDASTDGTQEIIKRYQKQYSNIKTVLQEENQFTKGKTHPDEALFHLIAGKYVSVVEGDDCWCDDTKLQKQFDALSNNSDCPMCVHKSRCIDAKGTDLGVVLGEGLFEEGVISSDEIFKVFFEDNNWAFQTSSYFMRVEVLLNRPYFWKKFYVTDLPTILWFAHNGNFFFLDDTMSCYRMFTEGSATVLNRQRDYAIRKAKTNAEGLIAFNEYTSGQHWSHLKHVTSLYIYQYYAATKNILSDEYLSEAIEELSSKEKITAKLKFTKFGYLLRNIREDINKTKMEGLRKK